MRVYLVGGLAVRNSYLRPLADELHRLGYHPKVMALPRHLPAREYAQHLAERADDPGLWIGHSFGTQLIQLIAHTHPKLVTGLVLCGPAQGSSAVKLISRLIHDSFYESGPMLFHALKSYFLTGPEKFLDEARYSKKLLYETYRLRVPSLVIHGENDKFTGFVSSYNVALNLAAEFTTVPMAAHGLIYTHPHDIAIKVDTWQKSQ